MKQTVEEAAKKARMASAETLTTSSTVCFITYSDLFYNNFHSLSVLKYYSNVRLKADAYY